MSEHYLLVLTLLLLVVNGYAAERCKGFRIEGKKWIYNFNPVAFGISAYCWYQVIMITIRLYGG